MKIGIELSVLNKLKISTLIYSGLNFSDLVSSIPEISNTIFSFFIAATVINCYLLLLLWNKTLNTFNYYIIPSKELRLEEEIIMMIFMVNIYIYILIYILFLVFLHFIFI